MNIEVGILNKSVSIIFPPFPNSRNALKITMTKRHQLMLQLILVEEYFFIPYPLDIIFNIVGTITAGETAARTLPNIPAQ